jgi:hypothetical protein
MVGGVPVMIAGALFLLIGAVEARDEQSTAGGDQHQNYRNDDRSGNDAWVH